MINGMTIGYSYPDGRKNWWEMSEDMQEQTYLMDMNKATI